MRGIARAWAPVALACAAVAAFPAIGQVETTYDREERPELRGGPEWFRWQTPGRVTRLLSIRPGEVVAEVGAASRGFTPMLSSLVSLEGKVYALVTDPALMDGGESAFDDRLGNIEPRLMQREELPLDDASVDLVLVVNRWHRLADRGAMAERIRRALKPGGRLAIVDWHDGEIPIAPPLEQRVSRETVVSELTEAGWDWTSESHALEYQYFLVFTIQP